MKRIRPVPLRMKRRQDPTKTRRIVIQPAYVAPNELRWFKWIVEGENGQPAWIPCGIVKDAAGPTSPFDEWEGDDDPETEKVED